MHAFIIEDDYLISRAIEDILRDIGFRAFSFARSEDAAVAGAAGETFDLITADARLLPGDGVSAVEAIRTSRNIPVVFVTGYAEDIRERLQGRVPDAAIVSKPIDPEELAAAVRKVLGGGPGSPET